MYHISRLLQNNSADWKRCLKIGILAVLGMLTHYNFVVFTALTGLITGVVLCQRRQWQLCVRLGIVLAASFTCFLLLFPPAIDVMIVSDRGREAASQFKGGFASLLSADALGQIMQQYLTWLWHATGTMWELGYVALAGILVYKYKHTKENRLIDWLLCVAAGMWIYTVFTMPDMYKFSVRYSILIFPLVAIGTVWYLVFCLSRVVRSPQDILTKWMVAGIILVNSWAVLGFKTYSPFAFYDKDALSPTYFTGKNVVITQNMDLSDMLAHAKQVFMVHEKRTDQLQKGLDKADFFVHYRQIIFQEPGVWFPDAQKRLNPAVLSRLTWLRRFHSATYEYDLYLVKHKKD